MEKTIEQPCPHADMTNAERDDWGRLRIGCRLLGDGMCCPFAASADGACKLCPLPGYHASDPVSRLEGLGVLGNLAVLGRKCLGSCSRNCHFCSDKACVYALSEPDPKTGVKAGVCESAASQLRIMYLGAEWWRRRHRKPNLDM